MRNPAPLMLLLATLAACGGGGGEAVLTIRSKLASVSAASGAGAWTWLQPSGGDVAVPDAEIPALCDGLGSEDGKTPLLGKALKKGWIEFRVVEVTPAAILHAGRQVLELDGGTLRAEQTRGMLVEPLFAELSVAADAARALAGRCPARAFDGRLLLAVDRRVPFETVRSVLYTAGHAEFAKVSLLVSDMRPSPPPRPASDANTEALLLIAGDGSIVASVAGAAQGSTAPGVAEMGVALDAALGARATMGCAVVTPDMDVPWTLVAAALDQLASMGIGSPVIGGTGEGLAAATPAADAEPPVELAVDSDLAVLPVAQTRVGLGSGWCDPALVPPTPAPVPEGEPGTPAP